MEVLDVIEQKQESLRLVEMPTMELIELAEPLLTEHWDEIARNKRLMVLKPDLDAYERIEGQGLALSVAAFRGADLIGYTISFIARHLHYSDLIYAQNDVLFLRQSHRLGRTGLRLMRETERLAKDRGARMMLWHAKQGTTLDKLMQRLGYGVQDIMYSREI